MDHLHRADWTRLVRLAHAPIAYSRVERAAWMEQVRAKAEHGDPTAEAEMGYLYENGKGVPQDYAKALNWYTKAANQGWLTARDLSARCTTTAREFQLITPLHGIGIRRPQRKAMRTQKMRWASCWSTAPDRRWITRKRLPGFAKRQIKVMQEASMNWAECTGMAMRPNRIVQKLIDGFAKQQQVEI